MAGYVHASGAQDGLDQDINAGIFTTLNGALNQCRSGKGDYVFVLPGHTESISSADYMSSLKAGTNIICLGEGDNRPTFTWTTAASTWLFDVANVTFENAILEMSGAGAGSALSVAAPITVSAAGCRISGCRIVFANDADELATIGITTTAAADQFTFAYNHCYGATTGEVTTFMQIVGADNLRLIGNYIQGATSNTGVGIIRFATTASTNILSENNYFGNKKALSTCSVTGLAGVSGVSKYDHFHYLNTTSLTPWLTSTGDMSFHRPTVTNTTGETGTEVVGTVSA
ncbi:MAG: hypothetical protein NW202_13465 [Nitrospira sp.]|nr:hypothetical protein [Nitrospira sp.]